MGEVRLGDMVGVSGFGVGHRLAGPRLLAVDDGGELVGGAFRLPYERVLPCGGVVMLSGVPGTGC
jgi:hypothetical protein